MMIRPRLLALCLIATAATLGACGSPPLSSAHAQIPPDPDEEEEFQQSIGTALNSLERFVDQTKSGKNLSDQTLGLFVSNQLAVLSGREPLAAKHIFADGRLTEGYLTDVYQYHPDDEIRFFNDLAQSSPRPAYDRAIAKALEILKLIPSSNDPAEVQANTRDALIKTLLDLRGQLTGLIISR